LPPVAYAFHLLRSSRSFGKSVAGCIILGIDDNGERRDLAADRAEPDVGEQEAAVPTALMVSVDGTNLRYKEPGNKQICADRALAAS